jgi:NADH-quinone oxidoreductase subunit E
MSPRIGPELRHAHKRELKVLGEAQADVDAILAKYPNKRSALPQLLFLAQSVEGYVTEEGMRDVGQILDIEPAEVLAVASFYTMFKKTPQGDYLISVCRNISCTHLGGRRVLRALEDRLGIGAGQTTPDGRFSLEAAECLATCDGAPSMQINYEDFYKVTADTALYLVDRIERGDEVTSVAGATVKTAKETARETALTGTQHPTERMEPDSARIVGGESPPADLVPGFRPSVIGGDPHHQEAEDSDD